MSFPWANEYKPQNAVTKWVDERLPLPRLVYNAVGAGYPVPRNLNRLPKHAELSVAGTPEQVAATISGQLRGWRRSTRTEGGITEVSAEKGYLREFGNIVFHFSLLGLLEVVFGVLWFVMTKMGLPAVGAAIWSSREVRTWVSKSEILDAVSVGMSVVPASFTIHIIAISISTDPSSV